MGQSVVVANGIVEAIEGVEGTDRMLARVTAAERMQQRPPRLGVLVKRSNRPDLRIDVDHWSTDGIRVHDAGLEGIARRSGRAHAANVKMRFARAMPGLFIEGIATKHATQEKGANSTLGGTRSPRRAWPQAASRHPMQDALKAAPPCAPWPLRDRSERPSPFAITSLLVVTGEGAAAASSRKQAFAHGRADVREARYAAIREARDLTPNVLAALAEKGFAGAQSLQETFPRTVIDTSGSVLLANLKIEPRENSPLSEADLRRGLPLQTRGLSLFIVAGEHSGDALGGKLMAAINALASGTCDLSGRGW